MTKLSDGGPAFPVTFTDKSGQIAPTESGMTLRDYIAIHANTVDVENLGGETCVSAAKYLGLDKYIYEQHHHLLRAKARYEFADAMLAERERSLASAPPQ